MSSILDSFKRTSISVSTYLGANGDGDLFADPINRRPFVEDKNRQVRSGTGEIVNSQTTLYDELIAASTYTAGSRVTVNGRSTLVLVCAPMELGDPEVDHVQVSLT